MVKVVLSRFFFKEKPVRTLAALVKKDRVWYANMLCKEIDCTYPHMVGLLSFFEQCGLIATEPAGRIKIVRLTPRGEDLAHEFEALLRRFDRLEADAVQVQEQDEFSPPQPVQAIPAMQAAVEKTAREKKKKE